MPWKIPASNCLSKPLTLTLCPKPCLFTQWSRLSITEHPLVLLVSSARLPLLFDIICFPLLSILGVNSAAFDEVYLAVSSSRQRLSTTSTLFDPASRHCLAPLVDTVQVLSGLVCFASRPFKSS